MSQEQKKPRGFANKSNQEETKLPQTQSEAPNAQEALDRLEKAVGNVKCIHGANDDTFAVAGQKVSTVRASLVDAFNIPADALTFVDGEQVDGNYILQENQVIEWVRQAGVKGC